MSLNAYLFTRIRRRVQLPFAAPPVAPDAHTATQQV